MFKLIKKIFMGLLVSRVNASNHTKCISLSNQKCTSQPSECKNRHVCEKIIFGIPLHVIVKMENI